jgi:DNA polymerase-1
VEALTKVFTQMEFYKLLNEFKASALGEGTLFNKTQINQPPFNSDAAQDQAAMPDNADWTKTQAPELASNNEAAINYQAYVLVDSIEAWDKLSAALTKASLLAVNLEAILVQNQAHILGLSLATGKNEAFYIPIAHQTLTAKNQSWDMVKEKIGSFLTSSSPLKIGQNAKNDWQILSRNGLKLPPPADDPMLASYLLNPDDRHELAALSFKYLGHKYLSFKEAAPEPRKADFSKIEPAKACYHASEKADLTLRLASQLRSNLREEPSLEKLYDEVELPLEELLARIEETGVLVDPLDLSKLSSELGNLMYEREQKIFAEAGRKFNISSPKQLSDVLFVEMGLPSGKKTAKKTGFSTDSEVLTELSALYPIASEIVSWRELAKLKNTYADKLPLAINPATGRIHTSYNQALTATGRLSSSDPNLQNIPARTEEGLRIRAAFKSKPGCRLVSADYSQIELRIMAHFSHDEALIQAFSHDEDVHSQTAAQIFGLSKEEISAEKRREAKTINFGIIYGQGAYGLSKQLGIPRSAAADFIDLYFQRFPAVKNFIEQMHKTAAETGQVSTWFGRRRFLPAINSGGMAKREAERMAVNTPIQGTAADIIKMAMLLVDRRLQREKLKSVIIMQVHDELVLEVPLEELDKVKNILVEEMVDAGSNPPLSGAKPLTVPLKVDVADGEAWVHA